MSKKSRLEKKEFYRRFSELRENAEKSGHIVLLLSGCAPCDVTMFDSFANVVSLREYLHKGLRCDVCGKQVSETSLFVKRDLPENVDLALSQIIDDEKRKGTLKRVCHGNCADVPNTVH
jgi:hypothetical protein